MKRDWKPGDVAMVRQSGWDRIALRNPDEWLDDCGTAWDDAEVEKYGRPLVVIDPENRERVADLLWLNAGGWGRDGTFGEAVTDLQVALREFANPTPPSPPEPSGLGAVVETVHGELYVRDKTTTTVAHWKRARGEESGKRHRYDDLRVVRVLSEGVQA